MAGKFPALPFMPRPCRASRVRAPTRTRNLMCTVLGDLRVTLLPGVSCRGYAERTCPGLSSLPVLIRSRGRPAFPPWLASSWVPLGSCRCCAFGARSLLLHLPSRASLRFALDGSSSVPPSAPAVPAPLALAFSLSLLPRLARIPFGLAHCARISARSASLWGGCAGANSSIIVSVGDCLFTKAHSAGFYACQ